MIEGILHNDRTLQNFDPYFHSKKGVTFSYWGHVTNLDQLLLSLWPQWPNHQLIDNEPLESFKVQRKTITNHRACLWYNMDNKLSKIRETIPFKSHQDLFYKRSGCTFFYFFIIDTGTSL